MVCVAWGYRERSMRGFVWTRFGCAFLRSLRGSACRPAEWCFIFAAIAHRQDSSTMYTIVCAEAISSDALCGASSRSSEIFREGVRGRSTQRRQNRRPIESNELPSPSTRKSDRQPLADAISGLAETAWRCRTIPLRRAVLFDCLGRCLVGVVVARFVLTVAVPVSRDWLCVLVWHGEPDGFV